MSGRTREARTAAAEALRKLEEGEQHLAITMLVQAVALLADACESLERAANDRVKGEST